MKKIEEKFNFRGARNAEHMQVHEALMDAIPEEIATGLNLTDERKQYVTLYNEENKCYCLNPTNVNTATVEKMHAQRVQQFTYILKRIDSELTSGDAAMQQAAEALLHPVKPYRSARRERYAATSGALTDFVGRMREADCLSLLQTLQLVDALDRLDLLNESFKTEYDARSEQFLGKATSYTMRTIRPLVDKAFKELAVAINSHYRVHLKEEGAEEKVQQLEAIIDRMNALLYQLQLTLARVKAGVKPNPGEEAKPSTPSEPGSTEPEEPADPSEPTDPDEGTDPEPDIPEIV